MKRVGLLSLVTALFVCLIAGPSLAEVYKFKIGVETVQNHPRNKGLVIFIDMLKERSKGRLEPTLYHSAQLYKGTHVPKALGLGTLEMGAPGIWQLEGYDVNASITSLPMFAGQPPEITEKMVDGKWGQTVSDFLGKKIKVKVPGPWYELGDIHVHTMKKPIRKLEDFKGLKIRYFGSSVNAERLSTYGASPMKVSWPDVPMAMVQGTVDGLITSFKSAEGAKLNEAGMKYSTKDYQCILHYVPMVSLKFWNKLPKDLQKIFIDTWTDHVPKQREIARKDQVEAEQLLQQRGVEVISPSKETLLKWRKHLMSYQEPFVKKMKMDSELVGMAKKMLGM